MACRNLEKAEAAAEEIRQKTAVDPSLVSVVQLDLSDFDSVRDCSRKIYASEPRLDVLINNAGVGLGYDKNSKQGYEYTFVSNHLGHFLLTHLLLGLLKKSSPSRIINVSSLSHHNMIRLPDFSREAKPGSDRKYPGLFGYPTSKLAQILHTNVLAKQLKEHGIVANSMHPGYVSTGIWYPDGEKKILIKLMKFLGWLSTIIGRTPKDAAQTAIYMAADPALEKVSGQYFENVAISDQLSTFAKDPELAQKMWDVSSEMCGLTKKVE
ncbi:RDH12 [Acanthosepion pharaonis]|uniref:RDH12 n=1 Tax=Acanthosepion pharaonis TaxID=158019 RepID=A0A812DZ38_ACAPH|nr:RDH12 [Sepia pharaonis]